VSAPAGTPGALDLRSGTGRFSELRATGIEKRYGGVHALRGVNFSVRPGEVVCLLGENGAGKSTLSRIISGIERPDAGTIEIDGEPAEMRSPTDAHALGVRVVPQELTLVPELSVAENVLLGALPRNRAGFTDWRRGREIARERLATLALTHLDPRALVGELKVVDQAFVQIARALTPGTRVLIADEPTAPMSGAEASRLIELLEAIKNSGVGVIFISHRLDEVFRLGDRVVVLRDGRNALDAPVKGLGKDELVQAMTGRAVETMHGGAGAAENATQPVLEIESLSGGLMNDISLVVRGGEVVGVYGNAGSGREEIAVTAFGGRRAKSGVVRVAGVPVRAGTPGQGIRAGLAYVPAERRSQALALEMSVRENLTMPYLKRLFTQLGFVRFARERAATRQWMSRLSLKASSTETIVGTLSGGTQQKVVLARWLLIEPTVLLLDEPTRGVDVGSKREIYDILIDSARAGVGVFVASSDAEELEQLCDRVYVVVDGRVTAELQGASQNQILRAAQDVLIEEKTA
jgi:ABC-type sugar transport system ATPase subunit